MDIALSLFYREGDLSKRREGNDESNNKAKERLPLSEELCPSNSVPCFPDRLSFRLPFLLPTP